MIKKDIFNKNIKARLQAAAEDKIHRFLMADKMIRGAIVKTTRMVNEMKANHEFGNLETLILGQAYTAGALLCTQLKGKDRVSIQVQCSGPVQGLDVESNVFGEVRGFLKNHTIQIQDSDDIKSVSSLFGDGYLTITKYLEDAPKAYSGKIKLKYKTLAEDLANYFLQSEQIPTGFNLSVFFDSRDEVTGAGGIFLQALPGVEKAQVILAEHILENIPSLGEAFANGMDPESIILKEFEVLSPRIVSAKRVEFFCRCSRDGMANYLQKLPRDDINDMITNGPFPIEIRCHHCNSVYHFSKEDLQKM